MSFEFRPCQPNYWEGRYAKIPGNASVFHIQSVSGRWWPTIKMVHDGERGICMALESTAAMQLAKAVNVAKVMMGGSGGGSFLINEFQQVVVPSSNADGSRMKVGVITGKFLFKDPFAVGNTIDLSDAGVMQCGDALTIPYLGIPYHLSGRSQIYFYRTHNEGGGAVYPPAQDQELVASLRKVRRTGPVKFIVNPYGLVATKKPINDEWEPEEEWVPIFIGRVNFNQWFTRG